MKPSHITLLAPVPPDYPTGGFEYNRRIEAAVRNEPLFRYRFVDNYDLPPGGVVVLDSLFFSDTSIVQTVESSGNLVGWLVHALGSQLESGSASPLHPLENELLLRSDFAVTPSRYMATHLSAEVPDLAVGVVRPGVDSAEIPTPGRAREVLLSILANSSVLVSERTSVAVTLGALSPVKNQAAFLPIVADTRDLVWVVIGSSSTDTVYARTFFDTLKELSLGDRVVWVPPVSHDVALHCIAGADVYVQPSRFESYGMALAEARVAGTEIVASDVGGAAEAAGAHSALCPPDDKQCWAASVAEALTRHPMSGGGRKSNTGAKAPNETWEDAGKALLEFIMGVWEEQWSNH